MSRANLPVLAGTIRIHDAAAAEPGSEKVEAQRAGASAFDAQLMGQEGRKRGLKGGPPVLKAARATYLGAEYSGGGERRTPLGLAASTKA